MKSQGQLADGTGLLVLLLAKGLMLSVLEFFKHNIIFNNRTPTPTKICARNAELWTVVERWEKCLIRNVTVLNPVEETQSCLIVDNILNIGSLRDDVHRTFRQRNIDWRWWQMFRSINVSSDRKTTSNEKHLSSVHRSTWNLLQMFSTKVKWPYLGQLSAHKWHVSSFEDGFERPYWFSVAEVTSSGSHFQAKLCGILPIPANQMGFLKLCFHKKCLSCAVINFKQA